VAKAKPTQYYLRGFNLDHGTDLRTTVDGMLVNQLVAQRPHHGGYTRS
jgi:hypothetical protein